MKRTMPLNMLVFILFALFCITGAVALDSLQVGSPNGGETSPYYKGCIYPVTWGYSGDSENIRIELFKGGVPDSVIANETYVGMGFSWTVPTTLTPGSDYQIKISSISNPAVSDMSDLMFRISESPIPNAEQPYRFVTQWGSEGTGNEHLYSPYNIVADAFNNIYVADGYLIKKFSQEGNFQKSWYAPTAWTDFALDSDNNFYFIKQGSSNSIEKYSADGNFIARWGIGLYPHKPSAIYIDPYDAVYVVIPHAAPHPDGSSNVSVQVFSSQGSLIREWDFPRDGEGAVGGYDHDIIVNSDGELFLVDEGSYIKKFSSDGSFLARKVTTVSGDRTFCGAGCHNSLATDSAGNIFFVGSIGNRILKYSPDFSLLTKWGGSGTGSGLFNGLNSITADSAGNIYVVDSGNRLVQKFAPAHAPLADYAGDPLTGFPPLTVNFIDKSSNNPTSWNWDVDGDGITDYTTKDIQHIYMNPGSYTVRLTVSNAYGSTTKTAVINVKESKPDLVFEKIVFFNENMDEVTVGTTNQQLFVQITLKNEGTHVDQTDILVRMSRDDGDVLIGERTLSNIPSGSSVESAIPLSVGYLPSEVYPVYAVVDPESSIDEINEDNNVITTELKVLSTENLNARLSYPAQNQHITYGDYNPRDDLPETDTMQVQLEVYDVQNGRRIDFIQNSKLIGSIHSMSLKVAGFPGGRINNYITQIPHEKYGPVYNYDFDIYKFKQEAGSAYGVDPDAIFDPDHLSFVWGEYWVHSYAFVYPPNEKIPEQTDDITLMAPSEPKGYFTLGHSGTFQVDQIMYPIYNALYINQVVGCWKNIMLVYGNEFLNGEELALLRGFDKWTEIYTYISTQNWDALLKTGYIETAQTLVESEVGEKIDLPILGCLYDLGVFIAEKTGLQSPEFFGFSLWSPCVMHVYDQQGNHVGLDDHGNMEEGIPAVWYSGPSDHPQVVAGLGNYEGYRLVINGTGQGTFTLKGLFKSPTARKEIQFTVVPISETGSAEIILGSQNPDYLMTVDADGDGTTDEIIAPTLIPPLPLVLVIPGCSNLPTDPDGDGIYEDLNGNGRLDFADVVMYFNQMSWIATNEPIAAFDLNGNGRIDFADIVVLFNEI